MKILRVLIVDDHTDALITSASLVTKWGYQVKVAPDGESALKIAEHFQPHVVILDILMPGMSGYVVANKIREIVNYKTCTIIGLSGLTDDASRHKGWDWGFHFFLTKPFAPQKLQNLLQNLENSLYLSQNFTTASSTV